MFNIIAIPRSRTAWLSQLFTHDKTICLHDWYTSNEKPSERSDIAYCDTVYHNHCVEGKTAFIHRDPLESMDSLKKAFSFPTGTDFNCLESVLVEQKKLMELSVGFHLDYKDLNSLESVCELWEYLTDTEAPKGRIMRMQKMKITVCYNNILDACSVSKKQLESLQWQV